MMNVNPLGLNRPVHLTKPLPPAQLVDAGDRVTLGSATAHVKQGIAGAAVGGALGGVPFGAAHLTWQSFAQGHALLGVAGIGVTAVAGAGALTVLAMSSMLADTEAGARALKTGAIAGLATGVAAAVCGLPPWLAGTIGMSAAGAVTAGMMPG